MYATLLLPAGVTSNAAIYYKDESELLDASDNPDETYVNDVLPAKMYYNLKSIEKFGFFKDIGVMFKTVFAVLGKEYKGDYVAPQKKETKEEENSTCDEKVDNVCAESEQNAQNSVEKTEE
jgi:lipopolysaccharide/colanic/teichoic acid biosynthesis glycosyltransferase